MVLKAFTQRIENLDAKRDHQEIIYLLSCHVFPWDIEKSLELALFRTFAIPSISKLLAKTGEFNNRPQKRYDDTELVLYEIMENGYDSEKAKRAFRRLNKMHGAYDISNDDFLYVLSTFIYEPNRWADQFSWRPYTYKERLAGFYFWREVGIRMGIKDIPDDYVVFEQFNQAYEEKHFVFAKSNQQVGNATVNLLLGFYLPKWLFWLGRPFAYSLMDDLLLKAMGFPKPNFIIRDFMKGVLRLRSFFLAYFPERKKPKLGTQIKRPTYPEGYEIEELGTFPQKKNR